MADNMTPSEFFDYNTLDTLVYADTPRFFSLIQYKNGLGDYAVRVFGEGTRYSIPDLIAEKPSRYQYDSTTGYVFLCTDLYVSRLFDIRDADDRQMAIDSAIVDLTRGDYYTTVENELIIFEEDIFHDNIKDIVVTQVEDSIYRGDYE
jgi:hypothetical protein